MKKLLKRLTKKSLALFMTVVMLLSCWVWFAPVPEAQAAKETLNFTLDQLKAQLSDTNINSSGAKFVTPSFNGTEVTDGYYANLLASPNYTNGSYDGTMTVTTGLLHDDSCADKDTYIDYDWHIPTGTVILYDGSTKAKIPVVHSADPQKDGSITVKGSWVSGNDFKVVDDRWYGRGGNSNTIDYNSWIKDGSNGLTAVKGKNDGLQYSKNEESTQTAGSITFEANPGTSDLTKTYNLKFVGYTSSPKDSEWTSSGLDIVVVNYIPLKNALQTVQGYVNKATGTDGDKYSDASKEDLRKVANQLLAAKPDDTYKNGTSWDHASYKADAQAAINALNALGENGGLKIKTHTVTWKDGNGDVIHEDKNVEHGKEVPTYDGSAPTKTSTTTTVYTFNNTWKNADGGKILSEDDKVTSDVTYVAQFDESVRKYNVIFKAESYQNGQTTQTYEYNADLKPPANPTKDGYTFAGWSPALVDKVTTDGLVYTATWTQNITVTFDDGKNVTTYEIKPGEKVNYTGNTPAKSPDNANHYVFAGWFDSNGNQWTKDTVINSTVTYTPKFTAAVHSNFTYIETKPRTCTDNAWVKTKCGICGYESGEFQYVATGDAALDAMYVATGEHDMDYNTFIKVDGTNHKFVCNICGESVNERHYYLNEDGSYNNEYSVDLGDATCVKEGTISYLCPCTANVSVTGKTNPDAHYYDYAVGTPIGGDKHTVACKYESSHTIEVECTDEDGDCYCDICAQELTHTFDQKKASPDYLKEEAKCEVNAVYYYSCLCGKKGTETWELEDSALAHEWIETENYIATEAACEVNATYYYECSHSLCGISSADKTGATWEKADSALEHVFNGEVVKNGDGTHSYRCSLCKNDVKGATTDCTYGEWDTTGAENHVKTCTACSYKLEEEHDWSGYTSTDKDLKVDGQHTRTCSVCDKVETEDCSYDRVETPVSCLEAGYTTHTCTLCGHEYVTEGTETAKGHDYSGEIRDNKDGTHSYLCKNGCGTYGYNDVEGGSAPCDYRYENTASGKHNAICNDCGYTKSENCSGGEATCSTPATCDKCNTAYGNTSAHVFEGVVVELEGGKHAYRCKYCIDNTSIYGVGSEEGATEDCTFNGEVVALDNDKHAYKCSICKDADYGNEETCSGGTATCKDLAVCAICQETYGELNADAHVWGDWTDNGNGTHTRTCTLGCTLENNTETAKCTTENATAVKTPATCNEKSYTTYTCNDCGYIWVVTDEGSALGHEWGDWTKNGDGTHTRTCLRECGEADATETLNCADSAEAKVTPPTCLEGGYTTYTCKDCGYTWVDETERTPAKGHTFETKRVTDELIKTRKDCTTPLTYWYICSDCELSAKEVENDAAYADKTLFWQSEAAAGHNFTAEIADEKYLVAGSSATCTTKVQYYKSCKACGLSSVDTDDEATFESGKILGHNWEKPADDELATYLATPADCITDATYYYVCSRCDISSKGVISATWAKAGTKTGHDFDHNDNGEIKDEGDTGYTAYVAPTCDVKGTKEHYTCEVCEKKFADAEGKTVITETSIKASGHAWLSVAYKAATCEEDGYARHQKCTVCGAESDHDTYNKLGHIYDAKYGYYCDEDNNYHAYNCKNGCGTYGVGTEKYTVILDETTGKVAEIKGGEACDFSGEYVQVENEGAHSHKKVCECGNEKSEACSDAKPETIAPSCAAEGYDLYVCDTCSQEWKTNYTNKTEHDYSKATWEAAAGDVHIKKCSNYDKCKSYIEEACYSDDTSTGTGCGNQKTCKICNDTFGASVAHDWVEKVDAEYLKSAANCDSPAVYYVSCSQCGEAHETVTFTYGDKRAHEMSDYVFTIEGWKFAPADFDVSQLKAPTCGAEGKSVSYCANCDYYKLKIEISSSTSHTWKYDIDNVDKWEVVGGNCGTGVTKKNICTVCGETTTKTVADPHAWSAVVIENATCTDNGFIELTCTTCFADKLLSGAKADFVFDGVDYAAKYPAVIAKGHHEWVDTAAEGEATMIVDGKLVFVEKYPAYNADGRGYSKCKVCAVTTKVTIPAYGNDPANHKHPELGAAGENTLKTVAKVEPTCIVGGHLEYKECTRCSYSQYMIDHDAFYLAPLGHSDSDNNGECDVCEKNLNGDKTDNCSCMCHKDSGFMKFIYKILRFFWKLFGSNKTCDCGKVHY